MRSRGSIAIVGCGPKGLYALDSLCEMARKSAMQHYELHIFEASSHPGAGPVYEPGQPDFLVMNFPAHMVDAWTQGRGPDLVSWSKDMGMDVASGDYVPRALVGQYLFWCFDRVVKAAPSNLSIRLHATQITRLDQRMGSWVITPGNISVNDVLVTTGHQNRSGEEMAKDRTTIDAPLLLDTAQSFAAVPKGATVACKGFALTFIDTMLALTEGRGGEFVKVESGYSYQPSGHEPALIAPFSRSGRPMRAKVQADRFSPPRDATFWARQLDLFQNALSYTAKEPFRINVWPALLSIADRVHGTQDGAARSFFDDWHAAPFDAERCRDELRLGYDIAMGVAPPDIGWALAEAWRRCYPQLVRWLSHRELCKPDADLFRKVSVEMERLAFGPPTQNVGKLICLEEIGLVSFDHLIAPLDSDITINATIPPAGAAALSDPLAGLLRNGHVEAGILGGLRVNNSAQAMVNGVAVSGLSIIGRATEGCVLGNDTLSRHLHDLPENWAKHVSRAASAPTATILERTV